MDAILALRLLAEQHRAFNRPLQVAYIDIKAAFDSVDRSSLWKTADLRRTTSPDEIATRPPYRNNCQSSCGAWSLNAIQHNIRCKAGMYSGS